MARHKKPSTFWINAGITLRDGSDMALASWCGLASQDAAKQCLDAWLADAKRVDGLPALTGEAVQWATICTGKGAKSRVVERVAFLPA